MLGKIIIFGKKMIKKLAKEIVTIFMCDGKERNLFISLASQ